MIQREIKINQSAMLFFIPKNGTERKSRTPPNTTLSNTFDSDAAKKHVIHIVGTCIFLKMTISSMRKTKRNRKETLENIPKDIPLFKTTKSYVDAIYLLI